MWRIVPDSIRLVAFDLDDTLAPSKSAIDPRIGDLLIALAERVEVAVISGGQLTQFRRQVVERLPEADPQTLEHLHLLPTCGTQYYRLRDGDVQTVYAHSLTDDEKTRALAAVEEEARRLGLWESATWGPYHPCSFVRPPMLQNMRARCVIHAASLGSSPRLFCSSPLPSPSPRLASPLLASSP